MLHEFIQGLTNYQFLQNALITSIMVGISAGVI
ncbi:MAG: manganese ABC transporter permease, partial [Enterococcus sp.]